MIANTTEEKVDRFYQDGAPQLVDVALIAVIEDLMADREMGCTGYHFHVSRRNEGFREIRTYDSLLELATTELAIRRGEYGKDGHSAVTPADNRAGGMSAA